jgi:hypothetical protein
MEVLHLFILLLIGLTIGFAIILGQSSRLDIMAHWSDRRCDFDVLLSSFYYKPDTYTKSAFDFASENLNFCVGSKADKYLKELFSSLYAVLQTQMGAADIMTKVMKTLRVQMNTIFEPFQGLMKKFWNKFKQIGSLSSRIFQHLYMSMKKAAATAIASMFVAISLQTAFMNSIDFVIKIIMIVLYILIGFAFIFFLPILPVLALVITTVGGIESALPGATGTMGEVFRGCFLNTTLISMIDGTQKQIDQIVLGDILGNGQTVESVIELPGSDDLYNLDGIYVTGDHRIWDVDQKKWILVSQSSKATLTTVSRKYLWTLITSDRTIPIHGLTSLHQFADWEEIQDTEEANELWESLVREILHSPASPEDKLPENAPCFDSSAMVYLCHNGWVPLSIIQKGDWILDDMTWTQVLGICHRSVKGGFGTEGSRMTSGVWIRQLNGSWSHPPGVDDTTAWTGMHLLTGSGTFKVYLNEGTDVKEYCVRDFTEVGFHRIEETYTRIEKAMKPLSTL